MASQDVIDSAERISIEPVRTRRQLREFITLPRRLYDGMPGYVAPLDLERRHLLDPKKSPFFSHGIAAYWIARRRGKAIGRISAQIDHAAVGEDADTLGMFGCLDAIDDAELVRALLATAEGWLRERGRRRVRGPFLLSINGEPGLLVEGQQEPPVTLLAWHPPYLDGLVRQAGYERAQRLLCFTLDLKRYQGQGLEKLAEIRSRAGITIRNLRRSDIAADMELGRQIFNDAWRQNWGFTPATETDAAALTAQFRHFLYPDGVFFVEVHGVPAAFILGAPNLIDLTADLGPAPGPLGWIKLLLRIWRQPARTFRLALIGIASKHQNTVLGGAIATIAFNEMLRAARARGVEKAVFGWIVESNRPTLQAIRNTGSRQDRVYSVYEKHLVE